MPLQHISGFGGDKHVRVYDNGIYRDATAEELAELEAMGQAQPPIPPTEAERLSALEAAMLELMMGGTGDG